MNALPAPPVLSVGLAQLRRKLLDLTGRNRLINFKYTVGKSLQFSEGYYVSIYQRLVDNNARVPILGVPQPTRDAWVERNGPAQRPDVREWATVSGIATEFDIAPLGARTTDIAVRALMYPDDLAKHCRKIDREARLAIDETGANMLFLVLGFLEFPEQRTSDRIFTAPLISVPVTLRDREIAGVQQFSLEYTGEDIEENLSLREKLRNDFGIALPDFAGDDAGMDQSVEQYIGAIKTLVENEPRFAVRHRVSLCLLSFSNMLLVRDLDPAKWPASGAGNSLTDHPIVRQVFEGTAAPDGAGLQFAEEHHVEEGPGARIPLVYDADSSQHSALVDVLSLKKNLVIEGPPGTGKSQTITNLIAASLAEGKKVLFVAEKLAALEVVKSRLLRAGLGPFVLELHSNKTSRKQVLEDIKRRIDFRGNRPASLPSLLQQLEAHRLDLKAYSDLLNATAHNNFGLTLHQIIWRAEERRRRLGDTDGMLTQVDVSGSTHRSETEFQRRSECLKALGSQYTAIGGFGESCTFWGFRPSNLVPGDEVRISSLLEDCGAWVPGLVDASAHFTEAVGGTHGTFTATRCGEQLETLRRLAATADPRLPLHLVPGFFKDDETGTKAGQAIAAFSRQVTQFRSLEPAVTAGLKRESSASVTVAEDLRVILRRAESLGVPLGTLDELRGLHQFLVETSQALLEASARVSIFLTERRIPHDGSLENLEQLLGFTGLVFDTPEQHVHLQTPNLARDGASRDLEHLDAFQVQWSGLETALEATLYVDTLPPFDDIRQAILTLREGDAWYRIFQSEWRRAIGMHTALQRTKKRMSSDTRRDQLEQVTKMLSLKAQWKTAPAWTTVLGFTAPETPFPLEGHLALAHWNRRFTAAVEDLQAVQLDPVSFTTGQTRAQRREFATVKLDLTTAIAAFKAIAGKLSLLGEAGARQTADQVAATARDFAVHLYGTFPWLEREAHSQASLCQIGIACDAALERRALREQLQGNARMKALLGDRFAGEDTDCSPAMQALAFAQGLDSLNVSPQIKSSLRSGHPLEKCIALTASLEPVHAGLLLVEALSRALSEFGTFDLDAFTRTSATGELTEFTLAFPSAVQRAVRDRDLLVPWSLYLARRKEATEIALEQFIERLEAGRLGSGTLVDAYEYCTYSTIIREVFRSHPRLMTFSVMKHNDVVEAFKRLDREIIGLRGQDIASRCVASASPPPGRRGALVDDKTEMVLLEHLFPQAKPRVPVRKILTRAGRAVQQLKPCFMMGPQAVAQYLAPGELAFDLVIMDEASQLKPEQAIGAIARGAQLVVVGDPKQLPPSAFFASMLPDGADGADGFVMMDAESILDLCSSHFRPTRSLRWHYRSQHHSLIAFSNHRFYDGKLVIFPSPYGQGEKLGVRAVYLADAVYAEQMNLREANRVVEAALEHIATRPGDSLGIVTLNVKQRDLIAELLEERLRGVRDADPFRDHWEKAGQPLFIKNLENVQGDERDAIIISTTFGKPPGSSAVRQNFGPISRQGGWRRLNVLFTRAKKSVTVYTSLRPEDIKIDGATTEGTKALRNYLEYVRSGTLTTVAETGREPDSDFEISVIDMLQSRGYEVTPQLGVAGYRIDIAVKHPGEPGAYLAAIECDGASYHSALSVRDRDRIRQEILESVGWRGRIWRIWSTDWFRTPRQETDKLMRWLADLRERWEPEHASGEAWIVETLAAGEFPQQSGPGSEHPGDAGQTGISGEEVPSVPVDPEFDLAAELGDVVRCVDLARPTEILTVRITGSDPLALELIAAEIGDQVQVRSDGAASRTLQVLEIIKHEP